MVYGLIIFKPEKLYVVDITELINEHSFQGIKENYASGKWILF